MSTDSEIILRSIVDPQVFGEIYDRHASSILRYASRRAGEAVGEDVMSETFLLAFGQRHSFDNDRDDAGPWLFGIATNLLRRHHRAEARLLRASARTAVESRVDDHARTSELADAAAGVRALAGPIRRMSAVDRDTLLLYAWADLSYEQIALAMAVPVGTVRSRLNRARRLLRDAAGIASTGREESHGRDDVASPHAWRTQHE